LPATRICTGTFAIAEDALEAFHVAEEQSSAFVGGEAARESDGKGVRIEYFGGVAQLGRGGFAARCGSGLAIADEGDQAAFAAAMNFEELFVRNIGDQLPHVEVRPNESSRPVGLEVLIVEIGEIAIDPAGQVDAVGHRGDGSLPDR